MVIRNLYVKYSLLRIKFFHLLYWKPYRAIFIESVVLFPLISMPTYSPRRALINLSPLYDTFWITLEIINTRMNLVYLGYYCGNSVNKFLADRSNLIGILSITSVTLQNTIKKMLQ